MRKLLSVFFVLLLLCGCTQQAVTSPTPVPSFTTPGTTSATVPSTDSPTNPTEPTVPPTTAPELSGCGGHETDPYAGMTKDEFYADYQVACCYIDAQYRSEHGFLSGLLTPEDGTVPHADYHPMADRQQYSL